MSGNFDQILGIISDGVVFVGPTGAPRLVNRAARDLLGTAVASIAREARVQKQIERIRSGEATPPLDCEIEVVREQRQQRLRVQILDWKAGGGFVLVIQEKRNDEVQESGMGAVFELIRRELSAPIESFVDEATAALGAAVADAKLHEAGSDLISRLTKLTTLAQVFGTDTVLAEERIGLRELINDLWPELKHLAGARFVAVSLRALDAVEPPIYGNRKWIRRALLECLDNAIRHARPGIDTEQLSQIEIVCHLAGRFLALSIKNTGLGFLPRRNDRVFLPFGRARIPAGAAEATERPTMGLGLPLAQRICELHGGHFKLEARDGELIECTLQFPTGAPLHGSSAVDIAQAQKYAQDLATLLARRRTGTKSTSSNPTSSNASTTASTLAT